MINLLEQGRKLKLKSDVRTDSLMEPNDILNSKISLNKVGHYEEPEWGLSKFTDEALFSGIKSFQKENNLKIDGVMKPGGETEEVLNGIIAKKDKIKKNKVKRPESFVPQTDTEANNEFSKIFDKYITTNIEKENIPDEHKMMAMGDNKSSGGDSGTSDNGEGFLGKMFSKIGDMVGLGDEESGSDGGSGDDSSDGKLQIKFPSDIKGGFENVKEGKGVYASDSEKTTGDKIAKNFPDLTKDRGTVFREMNKNAGRDISQFITEEMNKNTEMVSKNKLKPFVFGSKNDFYEKVTDNGDWDYKQKIADKITDDKKVEVRNGEWQSAMNYKDKDGKLHRVVRLKGDDKHVYDHDIFSNIHYGYVGKANGISDEGLEVGSRMNDAMKGNLKDALKGNDIAAVDLGIKLKEHINKTGEKLTPELLNQFIIKNRDKLYFYELN